MGCSTETKDKKTKGKAKRERYTALKLDEISAVDVPAQEHANAVLIMKRDASADAERAASEARASDELGRKTNAEKQYAKAAMTSSVNGHAHLLELECSCGHTDYASSAPMLATGMSSSDYYRSHSHPYIIDAKGVVTIGEAEGHTHDLAVQTRKNTAEGGTEETNTEKTTETETMGATATNAKTDAERISALETELATAKALASMTDAQKSHHAKLSGDAKIAFEKMDGASRAVEVGKALEADPVVYTNRKGVQFRKSHDPVLIEMARENDDNAKALEVEKSARQVEVYKRRAKEELSHLPGELDTHVALLKAVDGISDEAVRGKVIETLKANDAGLSHAFTRKGETATTEAGGNGSEDPEDVMDRKVEKLAAEKKISFEKAYTEFLDTEEGRALYAQIEVTAE